MPERGTGPPIVKCVSENYVAVRIAFISRFSEIDDPIKKKETPPMSIEWDFFRIYLFYFHISYFWS